VDSDTFWKLVEQSRAAAGDRVEGQAEALRSRLGDLRAEDVRGFHVHLVAASRLLYTWEHQNAAELAFGYLGDDGSTDFRTWIIAGGRASYERYLADPDFLAALLTPAFDEEEVGDAEVFGAVPAQVYEHKAGKELWETGVDLLEPDEAPSGVDAGDDEAVLRRRYPALAARFLAAR